MNIAKIPAHEDPVMGMSHDYFWQIFLQHRLEISQSWMACIILRVIDISHFSIEEGRCSLVQQSDDGKEKTHEKNFQHRAWSFEFRCTFS